jgi:hypothetical protein
MCDLMFAKMSLLIGINKGFDPDFSRVCGY